MPNEPRTALKIVAKLCDDNLACPERCLHDTANLDKAVKAAATLLGQPALGEAEKLRELWAIVSTWEHGIEGHEFLGDESELRLARQSWRECMTELRDTALLVAQSVGEIDEPQVERSAAIAVEGRSQGRVADTDRDMPPGEPPSNGHAVANRGDSEPEGPVQGFRWCYGGKITGDAMSPKPWKLANFLWSKRYRTAAFHELEVPVYDDCTHCVSAVAVGSLRREANAFFSDHNIPLIVSVKKGTVSLDTPPAVESH